MRRALVWGAVRSETISDDEGRLTLQTAEASDPGAVVDRVKSFIRSYLRRFQVREEELNEAILSDAWLLGYVYGACAAGVGPSGDTGLTGFTSRVCGELLGGGTANKVAAYERLTRLQDDPNFQKGRMSAIEDWLKAAS